MILVQPRCDKRCSFGRLGLAGLLSAQAVAWIFPQLSQFAGTADVLRGEGGRGGVGKSLCGERATRARDGAGKGGGGGLT